jgi:hypothetical protein
VQGERQRKLVRCVVVPQIFVRRTATASQDLNRDEHRRTVPPNESRETEAWLAWRADVIRTSPEVRSPFPIGFEFLARQNEVGKVCVGYARETLFVADASVTLLAFTVNPTV